MVAPLGDFSLAGELFSEKRKLGGMRCRCLETRKDTGLRRSDVANHLPQQGTVGTFVQQVCQCDTGLGGYRSFFSAGCGFAKPT